MEKVRLAESGQEQIADRRERGANANPVRDIFSPFFFFFLSVRCSGLRIGRVGVGRETALRMHRRRYTPLSPSL